MSKKYKEAVGHPQTFYDTPEKVLADASLSDDQKREVLLSWEAEAIHLEESTAEGFGGGEASHLDAIKQCLDTLNRQ